MVLVVSLLVLYVQVAYLAMHLVFQGETESTPSPPETRMGLLEGKGELFPIRALQHNSPGLIKLELLQANEKESCYLLPILNILVLQVGHTPWVAGLPFFIVIALGLFISFLALHLTQYASR